MTPSQGEQESRSCYPNNGGEPAEGGLVPEWDCARTKPEGKARL